MYILINHKRYLKSVDNSCHGYTIRYGAIVTSNYYILNIYIYIYIYIYT